MASEKLQQERFASAVVLLQGTKANFVFCWVSMFTSVVLGVVGVALIADEPALGPRSNRRASACISLLFLLAQAFTIAKVFRDKAAFGADPALALATPTLAYMIQVSISFAAALGCCFYSLAVFSSIVEFRGFFAMLVLWLSCNALCLSKAVRDRSDARKWRECPLEQRPEHLQDILKIARGTLEYRILAAASAILAVGVMLGLMWSWRQEVLAIERKGFITACVLWSQASSFHLAKLVRDRMDATKGAELAKQKPFQLLVVLSSLLSTGMLLVGIIVMPLDVPKKLFLFTGASFVLSASFFLAKNVRDRQEAEKLGTEPVDGEPVTGVIVSEA